ncbi:MAG: MFS transporter [Planctomycetota bacterium]|jgi:nucleoside transporter
MNGMSLSIRIRLSVMMFLQYMMLAVWSVPLAAYLTNIGIEGIYKATILSSMALGCLVAPIICMIADRHFASQKVLTALNFGCAVLFFLAAWQTNQMSLFVILLLGMFCYMPTWSLTNAIAMTHAPSEKFPQIRVFGSIGWVASGVFSFVAGWKVFGQTKIDGTSIPMLCGAGTALVTALINLTLPDTPPPAKGKESSIVDALGLRAMTLMKDFNFALFALVSMFVMIPFTMYWSYGSQFLQDMGFDKITITMNWGQFVEMFVMLLVPIALARYGAKWTMVVGLIALLVRYIAFWFGGQYDQTLLYYVGILVHGVIFGFFFVGGQVYVDKKAPPEIRAQAQGLIVLVCFGMGMLIGNFTNGAFIDYNAAKSEPVVAGYRIPKTSPSDRSTIPNADLSAVRLYGRALSDVEVSILSARDFQEDDKTVERPTNAASEPVSLADGLLASGDDLSAIAGTTPQTGLTFSAIVSLPEGKKPISGTLFAIGVGDDATVLGVEENKLFWRTGASRIAQKVPMPRGNDDAGNPKSVHVTATYDGKLIKLYTNGNLYRRVDWNTIWLITMGISVLLLAVLMLFFRDDIKKAGEPETASQGPVQQQLKEA